LLFRGRPNRLCFRHRNDGSADQAFPTFIVPLGKCQQQALSIGLICFGLLRRHRCQVIRIACRITSNQLSAGQSCQRQLFTGVDVPWRNDWNRHLVRQLCNGDFRSFLLLLRWCRLVCFLRLYSLFLAVGYLDDSRLFGDFHRFGCRGQIGIAVLSFLHSHNARKKVRFFLFPRKLLFPADNNLAAAAHAFLVVSLCDVKAFQRFAICWNMQGFAPGKYPRQLGPGHARPVPHASGIQMHERRPGFGVISHTANLFDKANAP